MFQEKCFEGVKISRSAHDSSFCSVNPKFLAVVVEVGGGGSFVVLPLDRTGRVGQSASKVRAGQG
jgi:coronin-2